MVSDIL